MRSIAILTALAISISVAVPASAQPNPAYLAPHDLDHFVGQNLFGIGHIRLGVVSAVDPSTGVIAVVGRHGEFARVSSSLVLRDGLNLWAPNLTLSTVRIASDTNLERPAAGTIVLPEVEVIEPPLG